MFKVPEGSTPINDISGLIPPFINTKEALDLWETENIINAYNKYLKVRRARTITPEFIVKVHRDMFDLTWKWAGNLRKENLNIGIDWHLIPAEIKKLCDDIAFWASSPGINAFEQGTRIHHRLAQVHPFKNGNGRHARMIADIFLSGHGGRFPVWPDKKLVETTDIRKRYIDALKKADSGDYEPLEEFTRKLLK